MTGFGGLRAFPGRLGAELLGLTSDRDIHLPTHSSTTWLLYSSYFRCVPAVLFYACIRIRLQAYRRQHHPCVYHDIIHAQREPLTPMSCVSAPHCSLISHGRKMCCYVRCLGGATAFKFVFREVRKSQAAEDGHQPYFSHPTSREALEDDCRTACHPVPCCMSHVAHTNTSRHGDK
jgi:hypothetical protein